MRSQGPKVIPVELKELGATVLVRRIDMLAMAQSGANFEPVKSTLLRIIHDGGIGTDMLDSGSGLVDTLKTATAVAKVSCVVPPEDFMSGAVDEYGIDARSLKPLFVDSDPDDDQVVLANYTVDKETGKVEAQGGTDFGYLHPNDLIRILASAYEFGPGALGGRFRGAAEARALGALAAVGTHGDTAE